MLVAKILVYVVFYLSLFAVCALFISVSLWIIKKSFNIIKNIFKKEVKKNV